MLTSPSQAEKFRQGQVCPQQPQFPPVDEKGKNYCYVPKPAQSSIVPIFPEEFRCRYYVNYARNSAEGRLYARLSMALSTVLRIFPWVRQSLPATPSLPISESGASRRALKSSDFDVLRRIPKRDLAVNVDDSGRDTFFCIYAREGISFGHFLLWIFACNVPFFAFVFVWMIGSRNKDDVQGAVGPLTISTTLTATLFASVFLDSFYTNRGT